MIVNGDAWPFSRRKMKTSGLLLKNLLKNRSFLLKKEFYLRIKDMLTLDMNEQTKNCP